MHHARSDDDDDDVESAEEDNEEELLIADPRAYPQKWGKREALIVAALIIGWYSVSTSALITVLGRDSNRRATRTATRAAAELPSPRRTSSS